MIFRLNSTLAFVLAMTILWWREHTNFRFARPAPLPNEPVTA